MDTIHSFELFHFNGAPSIFLAGPTPRSKDVQSWRPEAVSILGQMGFDGSVLIPERRDRSIKIEYQDQVEWEDEGLAKCTVVAFWVPRELTTMPAFTTNVEFGRFVGVKPTVYGRPDSAPKNRYLDWLYQKKTGKTPLKTLQETLRAAVEIVRA